MRKQVKVILQKVFGFNNYLLVYSLYTIRKNLHGKYEEEFNHFIELIPPAGIILDIGANIGTTAIPLSKLRGKTEVHAFEPISENYKTLQKVTHLHHIRNIKLYNVALGNENGELKMVLPVKDGAKQQGLGRVYLDGDPARGKLYTVPVRRLDDLFPDPYEIIAIKIDVENYEYEVLHGAENILTKSCPVVYCELWNNAKRQMVFSYMRQLNYEIYLYNNMNRSLQKIRDPIDENAYNFFFLSQNKQNHLIR